MIDGCPHCYFPPWAGKLGGTLGGLSTRSLQQPPELMLAQICKILTGTAHLTSDNMGGRNNHTLVHSRSSPAQPDPCRNSLLRESLLMTSVRSLVGFPPVGTSGTGLRPPLWAPCQVSWLNMLLEAPPGSHDVPGTQSGFNGAVAAVATFCSPWGPSTLSSTEGSLKQGQPST